MSRLFWKFFIFLFVAQLTAVIGVSLAIWSQHRREAMQSTGVEMSPPAQSLVEAAASTLQFGGIDGLKHLLEEWQKHPMPQLRVVDGHGQELLQRTYTQVSFDAAQKLAQSNTRQTYAKYIKLNDGQSFLLFVPDSGRNHGARGGRPPPPEGIDQGDMRPPPPEHMDAGRRSYIRSSRFPLMPILGGSLVSFLFAALLAWYFSKPISSLRAAFEQASKGKLDVRVAHKMGGRRDELSDLGHDFDAMASRLGSLLQGQTKLLHHVSHELRSPLARIQMALGLVRQNPVKIDAFLDRIEREANRMDKLVGELLELSRLESGVVQIKKETLELSQLLNSILEDAQFEAAAKQIKLHLTLDENCTLQGQPDLLYRAIENVVRNAIKYGPDDGEVSIHCSHQSDEQQLQISVTDQGAGVSPSELEDIFKPFVRGVSGSQTTGHGVGLAITKQVIEAHGGSVSANNLNPRGFCVQILLPC